ncbi:acyl carrier protein [candidate division WWE3 bacterium CG_4_10_14_0_2_um_filter_42_8]|uniref:Acyl carrier protein n=3 Tax=Katanobacteria TaxID=422282 RepID=A0A2M7TCX3_UNCKA|nr:MAG: acyl carrier protein [candidate division WWE3 bacterium CG_4_10_14_0_2_um_filter_42_8]
MVDKSQKMDTTVKDKIYQIIARQLGIDLGGLKPEMELISDLNIAPLDLVDLIAFLEEQFKMEIPAEEVKKLKTLGDLEILIDEKVNEI